MAKQGYNPVKAHEYYMRTRKLKGRQAAKTILAPKSSSTSKSKVQGGSSKLSEKSLVEQKAHVAQRISDIKQRLTDLTEALNSKLEEATTSEPVNKRPLRLDKFRDNEDPVIDQ